MSGRDLAIADRRAAERIPLVGGSAWLRWHRDGTELFAPSGLDLLLPAVAITVGIPLLEMNQIHGTTALWPGSHRAEKHGGP